MLYKIEEETGACEGTYNCQKVDELAGKLGETDSWPQKAGTIGGKEDKTSVVQNNMA